MELAITRDLVNETKTIKMIFLNILNTGEIIYEWGKWGNLKDSYFFNNLMQDVNPTGY